MDNELLEAQIADWVRRNGRQITDLASELIRFPTVNLVTDGTERDSQHYVASVLERLGLETTLYSPEDAPGFREHPAYYPGKDYKDRPNVAGRWRGGGSDSDSGNSRGRSLLFSSHIDTAVIAPGWSASPWEPYIKDGKLYGLGSFDMKGGLAASIMAVQCLLELGLRPAGDVVVESVVDEEFGGANGTLAGRLMGFHADAAIIPEPTNHVVCPATRGGALWRTTFRGKTGLAFGGETLVNPLFDAGRFLVYLEQYEKARSRGPGPGPWYESMPELPVIVTRAEAGDMQAALCDVGPEQCDLDIWVECHPGVTEDELQEEIVRGYVQQYGEGVSVPEFRKMIRFLPGSQLPPDFPLLPLLADEVKRVTGEEPAVQGAPFACDAFMFNLYSSTPAVVLGPRGANAHAADEYVEVESLLRLTEIYARIIVKWCGLSHADEVKRT